MGISNLDPGAHERRPWNAGSLVGAKRPLKPRDVWAIRFFLDEHRRMRDRALFDLAIDSKLRGCDVIKLKIGDVVSGGSIRNRATVVQQKTRRPVQFELMADCHKSLLAWLEKRGGSLDDFVFPSRVKRAGHLSTRQYAGLVDEWVSAVGLNTRVRYAFTASDEGFVDLQSDWQLACCANIAGHSKIENMIRYLGVDLDDALTLAERTEI